MTPRDILDELRAAGVQAVPDGDTLRLRGATSTLSADLIAQVRANKPALLVELRARVTRRADTYVWPDADRLLDAVFDLSRNPGTDKRAALVWKSVLPDLETAYERRDLDAIREALSWYERYAGVRIPTPIPATVQTAKAA